MDVRQIEIGNLFLEKVNKHVLLDKDKMFECFIKYGTYTQLETEQVRDYLIAKDNINIVVK